jgi:hypothetical protein
MSGSSCIASPQVRPKSFKSVTAVSRVHAQPIRTVGESAGWPLYHVQEMLGHASLEQTSTYLNVQRGGLRESMRKVDEFRSRCNPVVSDGAIDLPVINNHGQKRGAKPLIN